MTIVSLTTVAYGAAKCPWTDSVTWTFAVNHTDTAEIARSRQDHREPDRLRAEAQGTGIEPRSLSLRVVSHLVVQYGKRVVLTGKRRSSPKQIVEQANG